MGKQPPIASIIACLVRVHRCVILCGPMTGCHRSDHGVIQAAISIIFVPTKIARQGTQLYHLCDTGYLC